MDSGEPNNVINPASSALIVDPALSDAQLSADVVSSLGFHVTVADTFSDAVNRLRVPPALVIAEIRLRQYNGLHLVLRGKAARPDLAAIVTSTVDDPVLRSEAEQLGATFVLKPIAPEELRAAISRTVFRTAESSGESVRPPFERRKSERRVSTATTQPERRRRSRRRNGSPRVNDAATT